MNHKSEVRRVLTASQFNFMAHKRILPPEKNRDTCR